jgi:hypothetical protein
MHLIFTLLDSSGGHDTETKHVMRGGLLCKIFLEKCTDNKNVRFEALLANKHIKIISGVSYPMLRTNVSET